MDVVRVIEQVELAVAEWTTHVERCDVCLADGNSLCYEGQFLADEVALVREEPRADREEPEFHPFHRRPIFPGVPA